MNTSALKAMIDSFAKAKALDFSLSTLRALIESAGFTWTAHAVDERSALRYPVPSFRTPPDLDYEVYEQEVCRFLGSQLSSLPALATMVWFLSRVGMRNYEEGQAIRLWLRQSIKSDTLVELLYYICTALSKEEWALNLEDPVTVDDWEWLARDVGFIASWNAPTTVLQLVWPEVLNRVSPLQLLIQLSPLPRVLLLESTHPFRVAGFPSEIEALNLLRNSFLEPAFACYLFLSNSELREKWASSQELLEQLLSAQAWMNAGRYVLRRTFGPSVRESSALTPELRQAFHERLTNASESTEFLNKLEWPVDYEALSGFLLQSRGESASIQLPDLWVYGLAESFTAHTEASLVKNADRAPEVVTRANRINDVRDGRSRLALWMVATALILHAGDQVYRKWFLAFKSVLFDRKVLFYSQLGTRLTARRDIEFWLSLVTALSLETNLHEAEIGKNRVQEICGLLDQVIVFPYVRIAELQSFIFDDSSHKEAIEQYIEIEPLSWLLNDQMGRICKDPALTSCFELLLKSWRAAATTEWPWMSLTAAKDDG